MILIIQFRSDISGPHELKCIYEHGSIPYHHYHVINASSPEIRQDDLLAHAKRAAGVILGGWGDNGYEKSHEPAKKEVLDRVITNMTPTIEYLVETDTPTLGICFGHQLIATATGGEIDHDPMQAEAGSTEITLTEAGKNDPLLSAFDDHFTAVIGHQSSLSRLPKGAMHLASSERCLYQIYRLGNNVYGIQSHPEMSLSGIKERLTLYPDYGEHITSLTPTKEIDAYKILPAFIELCGETNPIL